MNEYASWLVLYAAGVALDWENCGPSRLLAFLWPLKIALLLAFVAATPFALAYDAVSKWRARRKAARP